MSRSQGPSEICPCTGLTIPECSCRRCLEEQMKSFSPLLRRGGLQAAAPTPPPPEDERRAA